uniref:Uncharacterized protein n=1 Tax=Anguilla anguilla TaxID=7936 RepID=A0A0E9V086_ANGAN
MSDLFNIYIHYNKYNPHMKSSIPCPLEWGPTITSTLLQNKDN